MKKIAIALMCMILASGAAMAQPEKKFTFGPKIGVDYTHYWGKKVDHSGVVNYQAGVFFEYLVADRFAIAPEVVFAAQGGKYDEIKDIEGDNVKTTVTDNVNYINIPLMFKFYVVPSLSIDFGPQLGINVYSKWSEDPKVSNPPSGSMKEDTKSIDFGLGLGLTYNITDGVFVQGRYTMGMTKVFKNAGNDKNGNAQIAIGYRF